MSQHQQHRIYAIDLLRGLVMVIMALDHTRDFFHFDSFLHDPLDTETTSFALYFTRWITNYCAPVFVFLAGTSIYLQHWRKSNQELSFFLFKRGLWLIFVELFIVGFSWTFDFTFSVFVLQVIFVLGFGMCCMGLLIRLPFSINFILGLAIVFGHNILDYIASTKTGLFWDIVHNGNGATHQISASHQLVIFYPFLPWLGIMILGYCFGKFYEPAFNSAKRRKTMIKIGLGMIALFIALRLTNSYGNPFQWSVQKSPLFTVLSFVNVFKYPPSLLFTLMTLGPAILFLAIFEQTHNRITRIFSVFGRVAFFYYVLHFYFLHILCMILFVVRGHAFDEITPDVFGIPFRYLIVGEGYSLTTVYIIWIGLVVALYPLCYWFNELKKRMKSWWLSYL